MKKIICFIVTIALILSFSSVAFAKSNNAKKQNQHQNKQTVQQMTKQTKIEDSKKLTQQTSIQPQSTQLAAKQKNNQAAKNKKVKEFKINGSPVIKYGRFLLPIRPVTQGMGATVQFDQTTAVLTVTKGTITIVIDFKAKTVTVNGVADTKSGIFTASNSHKRTVLIKYIAKVLGVRVESDDEDVTVEVPGLDAPVNVTVAPAGGTLVANTLNSTTLSLDAAATIKAGQAAGGKAELYVGSRLVAVDAAIAAADTAVTFTTSDGTPSNDELKAIVPEGGVVTVKLYNASNQVVTSTSNPTLVVDYAAPSVTGVNSAVMSVSGSAITFSFAGAGTVGDTVDASKISITDSVLGSTYTLTNASAGIVNGENSFIITLGSADQLGLAGFNSTSLLINLATGSLISDAAGNTSADAGVQTVPLTVNP